MEKEKGILLSGGGREETQAELNENEKLYFTLTDFIFKGLEKKIKAMKIDPDKAKDGIRRDVLSILRLSLRGNKNSKFNLYEILKQMDLGKIGILQSFEEPIVEVLKLEKMVEEQKEALERMAVQNAFSSLGIYRDVTDAVGGKPVKEDLTN